MGKLDLFLSRNGVAGDPEVVDEDVVHGELLVLGQDCRDRMFKISVHGEHWP